ncbi:MAG: fasciclin domain-containing protein [Ilumatobacteraceae bacterium]
MKRSFIAAVGLAVTAAVASPAVAQAAPTTHHSPTLVQILLADEQWDGADGFDGFPFDFDIVTEALQLFPDLVEAANSPGDLTVFLPTDQAFRRLVKDLTGQTMQSESEVFAAVASLGTDTVKAVLTYHIVAGSRITYRQALRSDGAAIGTLNGASFTVDVVGKRFKSVVLVDNDPDFRDPTVVFPNINASNGIAHAIDRVLLPINV